MSPYSVWAVQERYFEVDSNSLVKITTEHKGGLSTTGTSSSSTNDVAIAVPVTVGGVILIVIIIVILLNRKKGVKVVPAGS